MTRLIAAAILAALCGPALANGPPSPVVNWSGFYIGLNAGHGTRDSNMDLTAVDPATALLYPPGGTASVGFDARGGVGGIQAGFNWRASARLLAGIEADFNYADVDADSTSRTTLGAATITTTTSQELNWFGTVRGRLGFLLADHLLVYGTAGLAYGRTEQSMSSQTSAFTGAAAGSFNFLCVTGTTCFAGRDTDTNVGWTIGAGAEWKIGHVGLRVDYSYVDLGRASYNAAATLNVNPAFVSRLRISNELEYQFLRAGLNLYFN